MGSAVYLVLSTFWAMLSIFNGWAVYLVLSSFWAILLGLDVSLKIFKIFSFDNVFFKNEILIGLVRIMSLCHIFNTLILRCDGKSTIINTSNKLEIVKKK